MQTKANNKIIYFSVDNIENNPTSGQNFKVINFKPCKSKKYDLQKTNKQKSYFL